MVKTHTLFRDVHESILKLNYLIKEDGYVFEKINLDHLEQLTAHILGVDRKQGKKIRFSDGTIVTEDFYRAYNRSNITNSLLMEDENPYYIILTKIDSIENIEDKELLSLTLNETSEYSLELLKKLHLLKNSSIEYVTTIQHNYGVDHWRSMIGNANPSRYFFLRLNIDDDDLEYAERLLKNGLFDDNNFQLSLEFFQSAYRNNSIQICYLNLMMSLESIFNRGVSPIAHTIARHLAVILEDDKQGFSERYKEIKKMYDLRSAIVHGASKQDYNKISENFNKLRIYTLKGLQFVNNKRLDKKRLFDYLNMCGFNE